MRLRDLEFMRSKQIVIIGADATSIATDELIENEFWNVAIVDTKLCADGRWANIELDDTDRGYTHQ